MKDGDKDRVDITVTIKDGQIQSVDIPEHLDNVVVVVKDYDVTCDEQEQYTHEDKDGEHTVVEWEA
jgi:uncharacterized protein with FMN-binding domain